MAVRRAVGPPALIEVADGGCLVGVQLREAVDVLWGWESYSDEHVSTEALVEFLLGEPKPRLTRDRLNEIRKWMRADAAAEKRRATKERRRAQA